MTAPRRPSIRKDANGLTLMRKKFCAYYVADPEHNATRAAVLAGFSEKSAKVKASQMLDDPDVQKEINRLTTRVMYELGITALSMAREVKKIAFSNLCDYGRIDERGNFIFDLTTTTREQMAAVAEVSVHESVTGEGENKTVHRLTKLKLHPKLPALEILGRRVNAFPLKHEHSGANGGPITFRLERIGSQSVKKGDR
jgi:phage terminase small subunit